jgi:hypothetical protein
VAVDDVLWLESLTHIGGTRCASVGQASSLALSPPAPNVRLDPPEAD